MATAVYVLCMVTSAFCAVLLLREYRRTRARLLLWSSLSFVAWAANNALVFTDLVVLPGIDLSLVRAVAALTAITLLLYGLIWDAA
jgi:hypothetical protein